MMGYGRCSAVAEVGADGHIDAEAAFIDGALAAAGVVARADAIG